MLVSYHFNGQRFYFGSIDKTIECKKIYQISFELNNLTKKYYSKRRVPSLIPCIDTGKLIVLLDINKQDKVNDIKKYIPAILEVILEITTEEAQKLITYHTSKSFLQSIEYAADKHPTV